MVRVSWGASARRDLQAVPLSIRHRLHDIVDRLARWPAVSGAKPLRHELSGHYRIRTGDWRILFRVSGEELMILRIGHRKDVYEE